MCSLIKTESDELSTLNSYYNTYYGNVLFDRYANVWASTKNAITSGYNTKLSKGKTYG